MGIDRLITTKEVAEFLHCHPQSIYRNQVIPRIYIPGVGVRYRKDDLEKLIENQAKKSPQNALNYFKYQQFSLTRPRVSDSLKSGGFCEMAKAKIKSRYNLGYGAIYQRKTKSGNVRWYLDYRNSDGKRIQKLIPHAVSEEEATLSLQEHIVREFDREYRANKVEQKIKFSTFSDVYITNYAKIKKRSWKSDEKYIKAQLIPFFGALDLHEITPLHVSQFMVKRQRDGVKNSTINRELTVLKKMLAMAMDWGFKIDRNPVKKGNFFSEEEYKRDRTLTFEEEKRLFEASALHLKPILMCALSTGMRYSEILGLKWENVDLDKQQVTIRAESSKSGKQRVIPICGHLKAELSKLKVLNRAVSDHVFLYRDPKTGKFQPITTVRRAFTMACKRAKIQNFHFHDLRHTVGSRLIGRGVDPVTVKNILGHANLKTTEIYLHSSAQQMKAAVEKLDPASNEPEKLPNLLHSCDTDRLPNPAVSVIPSSTIN